MLEKFILDILVIIHVLVWLYLIFGGLISNDHSNIIVLYIIPFIYLIHILPFHVLIQIKRLLINSNKKEFQDDNDNQNDINEKDVDDIMNKYQDKNIISYIYVRSNKIFTDSFQNPLSPQGLLIIGFITNLYIKKYYWHSI